MSLLLTDGDEDVPALGGASFSLQRRLQPAPVALIGLFFRGAVSPDATCELALQLTRM
jgi:hypothetical protein